jgi:hypothetical protein
MTVVVVIGDIVLQGIVNVCRLFESLLQHQQPQLAQHLRMIGLQPYVLLTIVVTQCNHYCIRIYYSCRCNTLQQ